MKEKNPSGTYGRSRYVSHVPLKAVKQVALGLDDPAVELVTLSFSRVRHVCRFENGGWCKEKKAQCSAQICPQI